MFQFASVALRMEIKGMSEEQINQLRRSGYRYVPSAEIRARFNWGRTLTREAALMAADSKRRDPRHLLHLTWGVGHFKYSAWPRIRRSSFVWVNDRYGNVAVKVDPGSTSRIYYLRMTEDDFPTDPWGSWEYDEQLAKLIETWLLANI